MIISEQWLREYVNPDLSTETLAERLTMLGLEVDGIELAAPAFSGVVVGEIVEIEAHPDADKLRVCQVAGGDDVVQVVCGAKNAAKGLKVPFAMVGAKLPGDFKIKRAKLRGVESLGMLCAAAELGLAESSEGLYELPDDAPVGTDFREYLSLDDALIEVDLTPNRGDCLSMVGVAREVGTVTHQAVNYPALEAIEAQIDETLPIRIEAADACPRYAGRVIRGVDAAATTPLWLSERLRRAGVRPLSAVVDITNYVMLELGQPMHAFDLDKLEGGIVVRKAADQEALTTLDGNELSLKEGSLVIADEAKAVALAGVMGGEQTAVADSTAAVFLESAFFDTDAMAGEARRYGLHTDSSHRFERGVDPQLQERAIERATQLILEICGGQPGPVSLEHDEQKVPQRPAVQLRAERIERLLGLRFEKQEVVDILQRLGMGVAVLEEGWRVTPPSFRFDINIEADLIEELVRIYGYDRVPRTSAAASPAIQRRDEAARPVQRYKEVLVERGYQEAICYSFIAPDWFKRFDPDGEAIALANPISSELGVMRSSLVPGLVKTLQYNLNRQQKRLKLFEVGLSFVSQGSETVQKNKIAGLLCGEILPEQWNHEARAVDFFDAKGDVEALLALTGIDNYRFEAADLSILHPGQSAFIVRDGVRIGYVGALHPQLARGIKLKQRTFVFELDIAAIQTGRVAKFEGLSEFPATRRDIAVVVDAEVSAQQLIDAVMASDVPQLQSVRVFDLYQGENLKAGSKSVALGLILQDFSSTLTEQEIEAAVERAVAGLENKVGAALRE
ncbi:phenylalanyl-tRNA synthetase, beta subunit [gamma proteobacterium HTCC5015]|nr:phenylalanyl-tRNA synthetase, beta subunit [gamma proteobacterium HTCC5015]